MPYTKQELKHEKEATYFACALLMPMDMFLSEWVKYKEMGEEKRIEKMAEIFQVPLFAVVLRLTMIEN